MLGTKNPLLVDRRVYAFKGTWKSPQQDLESIVYYFISQQKTFVDDYENGRERLSQQMEITVFGEHPIIVGDTITLDTGEKYKVRNISFNYIEHNIEVRDLLKPMISSMILTLR